MIYMVKQENSDIFIDTRNKIRKIETTKKFVYSLLVFKDDICLYK